MGDRFIGMRHEIPWQDTPKTMSWRQEKPGHHRLYRMTVVDLLAEQPCLPAKYKRKGRVLPNRENVVKACLDREANTRDSGRGPAHNHGMPWRPYLGPNGETVPFGSLADFARELNERMANSTLLPWLNMRWDPETHKLIKKGRPAGGAFASLATSCGLRLRDSLFPWIGVGGLQTQKSGNSWSGASRRSQSPATPWPVSKNSAATTRRISRARSVQQKAHLTTPGKALPPSPVSRARPTKRLKEKSWSPPLGKYMTKWWNFLQPQNMGGSTLITPQSSTTPHAA